MRLKMKLLQSYSSADFLGVLRSEGEKPPELLGAKTWKPIHNLLQDLGTSYVRYPS